MTSADRLSLQTRRPRGDDWGPATSLERRLHAQEKPSTRSGGIARLERFRQSKHAKRGSTCRTLGAVVQLVRSWRRLAHVPTLMQIRAMAHFDGREPCSYLLDPSVNYVPELPFGSQDPLGRHALCFTGRHPDNGRRFELVTLPDGSAFELLGISG